MPFATATAVLCGNATQLLDAFSAAHGGMADKAIGRRLGIDDVAFFEKLRGGKGSWAVQRYDQLLQLLSNHWPPAAQWPAGLERPEPGQ